MDTLKPIYTNIALLLEMESAAQLVNLACDRSNGDLADADIEEWLIRQIMRASRIWDGYVQGHMALPIEPVIVELTGTIPFTNGSTEVVGTGTLFETELAQDYWIQPQSNIDAIHVVREVFDDEHLILTCPFFAPTIADGESAGPKANHYDSGVPDEVEQLVCDYTCYRLWKRRGKQDEDNPWVDAKAEFDRRVVEIQTGKYRFISEDAGEVARKLPYSGKQYTSTEDAVYEFTKDTIRGFYGD